jgi:hypothetical protein
LGSGVLEPIRLDEQPGPRWLAEYHRPG